MSSEVGHCFRCLCPSTCAWPMSDAVRMGRSPNPWERHRYWKWMWCLVMECPWQHFIMREIGLAYHPGKEIILPGWGTRIIYYIIKAVGIACESMVYSLICFMEGVKQRWDVRCFLLLFSLVESTHPDSLMPRWGSLVARKGGRVRLETGKQLFKRLLEGLPSLELT